MNTKLPENSLILLEGGSLRGLYTAGALDILMEHDLYFPAVAGVLSLIHIYDDVRNAIVKTEYNADLLPSNTQLAGAAVALVNLPRREMRLRSVLAPRCV